MSERKPPNPTRVPSEPYEAAIWRIRSVCAYVALSEPHVYNLMARGDFPQSIPLSGQARGWLRREVEEWIEERAALRATPLNSCVFTAPSESDTVM